MAGLTAKSHLLYGNWAALSRSPILYKKEKLLSGSPGRNYDNFTH